MAGPTVHQRVALFIIDHGSVSTEWLRELHTAGARVLKVHLQDHGPLPADKMREWSALGYKLWGAVRPSGQPLHESGHLWTPEETVQFIRSEKRRLASEGTTMHGIDCNFEQEIQQADVQGTGWSRLFTERFRLAMPTLPAQLDTYPVEGLDHLAYRDKGFRVTCQTYSPVNHWAWTPAWIMDWLQRVGWPKAQCKITLPVHEINGVRPWIPATVSMMKQAGGVKGCTLYPVESAMPPTAYLAELVRLLIWVGVAF